MYIVLHYTVPYGNKSVDSVRVRPHIEYITPPPQHIGVHENAFQLFGWWLVPALFRLSISFLPLSRMYIWNGCVFVAAHCCKTNGMLYLLRASISHFRNLISNHMFFWLLLMDVDKSWTNSNGKWSSRGFEKLWTWLA